MYRSAATTQEPLPERSGVSPLLRLIFARIRKGVRIEIPAAYREETGFHHGVNPAERKVKWRPLK
jgi:hypothetical protein